MAEASSLRPRAQRLVLGSAAVDALALGLYLASAGLFLAEVIGMSAPAVGVVLGVGGAASMVGAIPIARLTERYPGRSVLFVLFVVRGLAFLGFACARDPVSATLAVTAAGFLNRGIGPILQSIGLEGVSSSGSVEVLARIRALRNAGIALGGVPVGFVLAADSSFGFRIMVGTAGAIAAGAAAMALALPRTPPQKAAGITRPRVPRQFLALTLVYGVLTMNGIVLGLGVPLLIVGEPGIPRWVAGGVQVGNTVMVVLFQVIFSRGSEDISRARRMLVGGGLVSALGCLVLLPLASSRGAVAVALVAFVVVLFTVAELLASSGGSGMMLSFVPEGQRARYLAVFNLGFAGATIVGPPLVGLAVAHQPLGWIAVGVGFLADAGAAALLRAGGADRPVREHACAGRRRR